MTLYGLFLIEKFIILSSNSAKGLKVISPIKPPYDSLIIINLLSTLSLHLLTI